MLTLNLFHLRNCLFFLVFHTTNGIRFENNNSQKYFNFSEIDCDFLLFGCNFHSMRILATNCKYIRPSFGFSLQINFFLSTS